MRIKSKNSVAMTNKLVGYVMAAMGTISIVVMITIIIIVRSEESKIPEDAKWYTGQVSELLSSESYYEWREDSDGDDYRVKVYDCKAIIEYEINGQTYTYKYSTRGSEKPVREGELYYVKASPSKPSIVYKVSKSTSDWGMYLGSGIFGLVGLIFVIIGICTVISASKKNRASNYTEAPIYQGNINAGGLGYNNVEYGKYDYYNTGGNADYSGTSLRDE